MSIRNSDLIKFKLKVGYEVLYSGEPFETVNIVGVTLWGGESSEV